jgi:hypothetical protein
MTRGGVRRRARQRERDRDREREEERVWRGGRRDGAVDVISK